MVTATATPGTPLRPAGQDGAVMRPPSVKEARRDAVESARREADDLTPEAKQRLFIANRRLNEALGFPHGRPLGR